MKEEKEKEGVDESVMAPTPDGEAILREVDRESRYRNKLAPFWKYVVMVISIAFVSYHMITSRFGMPDMVKHRAIHVAFILGLVWLYYPATKKSPRHRPSVVDIILFAATVFMILYTWFTRDLFLKRAGVAMTSDYIVGAMTILMTLEACRRAVGKGLLILVIVLFIYAWAGPYFPGVFAHRGHTIQRIIYQMYLTGEGIFGMPIGVSATYLIIFIVLGAMLEKSGLGKLFNDIALSVGGRLTGGPAKVAVVASALVGMIQGSAATNVATSGAFTIPLMKKVGYKPFFAGAIEAAASTGGQFMPPIMGSVAFIMAEFLGIRYLSIAAAAIVPAILYFGSVFFQIDLRARRMKLRGLTKEEMPDVKKTILRYGQMMIPVFVLVFLLIEGRTPLYAAFFTVVTTWLLSWIRKETRIGPKALRDVAVNSSRNILGIGVAMASAGFVVAVLSMTGIGVILADNIVKLSGGHLFVALLLSMLVSIVLGMGLPTSACYVIAASITVPILTAMNVPAFQAHFFVLYFSVISTVTPPVALAAYVGAGMANADPTKVGWTAFRLAIAGFIIPFFFVYSPEILLISDSALMIVWASVSAFLGIALLGIAAEGYFKVVMPVWARIIFLAAAISLISPNLGSDVIGIVVGGLSIVFIPMIVKKRRPSEATAG